LVGSEGLRHRWHETRVAPSHPHARVMKRKAWVSRATGSWKHEIYGTKEGGQREKEREQGHD
jgi:hypothetical protein